MIIDWIKHAESIYEELKDEISKIETKPHLAVILVGENSPSLRYINQKRKWANYIGMDFTLIEFPSKVTQEELLKETRRLNKDKSIDWFMIQTPLPNHINTDEIIEAISPEKDVDGFHPVNQWKIVIGDKTAFAACTPAWIMELFNLENIPLSGKVVCVLWRSNIVWKPVVNLLINQWATVIACNSKTPNIEKFTKQADIVVLAIWQPGFLKTYMISDSAIIIDVGFSVIDWVIFWDADTKNIKSNGNLITPVPGWVWRMTVAMLLKNTLKAHKLQK